MNYLAHMVVGHWAGLDEKGVLGNFMGDAVKGRDVEGMWGADVGREASVRLSAEATIGS